MINARSLQTLALASALGIAPSLAPAASLYLTTYTLNLPANQTLRDVIAVDTFADGSHRTASLGSQIHPGASTLTNPFGSSAPVAGSLLMGLYTGSDHLNHVFVTTSTDSSQPVPLTPTAESRYLNALATIANRTTQPMALAQALNTLSRFDPSIDVLHNLALTSSSVSASTLQAAAPAALVPLPAAAGPALLTLALAGSALWLARRRHAGS